MKAEAIINGRPESSIERQQIIDLQKQTLNLVQTQIEELKSSNTLLKQEAVQRLKTIELLNDQIDFLKDANALKQKEIDSHKYDDWKTFGWIILTIILTIIITKAFEHLWGKYKISQIGE